MYQNWTRKKAKLSNINKQEADKVSKLQIWLILLSPIKTIWYITHYVIAVRTEEKYLL